MLLLLCCLPSLNLYSQTLLLEDVISLYKLNQSERESFLLNKQFDFEENESERIGNFPVQVQYYVWKSIPSNINTTLSVVIIRTLEEEMDSPFEVSYLTYIKKDYLSCKLEAINQGYEYLDTENKNDRINHLYENEEYRFVFYTATYKGLNLHGVRIMKK